jgi:hypothetical protein
MKSVVERDHKNTREPCVLIKNVVLQNYEFMFDKF